MKRSRQLRVIDGEQVVGRVATLAGRPWSPVRGVPEKRADCIDGPRPCRHIMCKQHNWAVDNIDHSGRPPRDGKIVRERIDVDMSKPSCALDVADAFGGLDTEKLASQQRASRREIQRIVRRAVLKLQKAGVSVAQLLELLAS